MTEKLYYKDAYIKEFNAVVLASESCDGGYSVTLDKTAFFPEEGGQYSDRGYINGIRVSDVKIKDGTIYHITEKPLSPGDRVFCTVDFEERFEKMQCHTAEHILSGIFHRLYGYENVGFHLGADEVTMDINALLSDEQIRDAEERANRIVYENVPVTAYFPSVEELEQLEYRSKLNLKEDVRIVNVGEYDSCACCAPHVSTSAEIGLIKVLDFMKHRGGTRIFISAGSRAFRDFRDRYDSIKEISRLLSVPKQDAAEGVKALLSSFEELKLQLKSAREELFLSYADGIEPTDKNLVLHFENAGQEDARILANAISPKVGGIAVILFGKEPDIKYLIVSNSYDLRSLAPEMNKALSGRGGGKREAIQGSFSASFSAVKEYFEAT